MAGGFFAVLKNISILADDASVLTKVALKNTMGILGDDLAVNAEKASGFHAKRELPVLYAITKGSFINKLIIVPIIMLMSAYLPSLILPILILGGVYLAYEGFEKIAEYINPHDNHEEIEKLEKTEEDVLVIEKEKIKAAIFTDFILSIEIILVALSSVSNETLTLQLITVSAVAVAATIGVYGIVALIVRLDDLGFYFISKSKDKEKITNIPLFKLGEICISSMGQIIRVLGYIGTVAMLLVAGGIFSHNIEYLHHMAEVFGYFSILFDFTIATLVGFIAYILHLIYVKFKII